MSDKRKVVGFVGGGTAGHITKLLAVMAAVQAEARHHNQEVHCIYFGLTSDMHSPLVVNSELEFKRVVISSGKLNRFLTLRQIGEFLRLGKGMLKARNILKREKLDVLFSAGGYVTVPLARAAASLRIPLIAHETDVIPGLANQIAAKHAVRIFTTFPPQYYTSLPKSRLEQSGQPVRAEFAEALPLKELEHRVLGQPLITIIGGSQGAGPLNELISQGWEKLLGECSIVHITGQTQFEELAQKADKLPVRLQKNLWLIPFIGPELPALFRASTLVVSRAGGTINELAAGRVASILLPLSTAAQNHQAANAQILKEAHAAVVLDETKVTYEEVVQSIQHLLQDTNERTLLAASIGQFYYPDAAARIAKYILSDTIPA